MIRREEREHSGTPGYCRVHAKLLVRDDARDQWSCPILVCTSFVSYVLHSPRKERDFETAGRSKEVDPL